jgi:hypothetical protein
MAATPGPGSETSARDSISGGHSCNGSREKTRRITTVTGVGGDDIRDSITRRHRATAHA